MTEEIKKEIIKEIEHLEREADRYIYSAYIDIGVDVKLPEDIKKRIIKSSEKGVDVLEDISKNNDQYIVFAYSKDKKDYMMSPDGGIEVYENSSKHKGKLVFTIMYNPEWWVTYKKEIEIM
jgi:hypothetical protein